MCGMRSKTIRKRNIKLWTMGVKTERENNIIGNRSSNLIRIQ